MKILKYQKLKKNEYKIITDEKVLNLYDDIIIKYELLLKKEITKKELEKIEKENNLLKAYYDALKEINKKMRTEKELEAILKKKDYKTSEIEYALKKLIDNGYINHKVYIEAYIHDMLALYLIGEEKIKSNLINLGLAEKEIKPFLEKIDKEVYQDKIKKYVDKKLKTNKKSINEFKRKTLLELINRGFSKVDILSYLDSLDIKEDREELVKIVNKLYKKYIVKYDLYTTKNRIKAYLYNKGYKEFNLDEIIEKSFD